MVANSCASTPATGASNGAVAAAIDALMCISGNIKADMDDIVGPDDW